MILTSRVPLPLQTVSEQMDQVKVQLQGEVKKVASLQSKVTEGEVCHFGKINFNVCWRKIKCNHEFLSGKYQQSKKTRTSETSEPQTTQPLVVHNLILLKLANNGSLFSCSRYRFMFCVVLVVFLVVVVRLMRT